MAVDRGVPAHTFLRMAVDRALVSYLEDLLGRARRGEVVAFIASAGVVELSPADLMSGTSSRVDAKVLVGISFEEENASRLDRDSLERLTNSVFDGAGAAAQSVASGLQKDEVRRIRRGSGQS